MCEKFCQWCKFLHKTVTVFKHCILSHTYLIFVHLVHRHIIKACKKYTEKCVNSQQIAQIGQNKPKFRVLCAKSTPARKEYTTTGCVVGTNISYECLFDRGGGQMPFLLCPVRKRKGLSIPVDLVLEQMRRRLLFCEKFQGIEKILALQAFSPHHRVAQWRGSVCRSVGWNGFVAPPSCTSLILSHLLLELGEEFPLTPLYHLNYQNTYIT